MTHHVIVLGGGVGGMSAAHELVERGFRVTVYEKGGSPGGKARSYGVPKTGRDGRRDLPAEHGFRFFPGFYRHLPDTMARIPCGPKRSVSDNLVDATQMQILFQGGRSIVVPARFPASLDDIADVLDASGYLTTSVGLTSDDLRLYCERVWQVLTSCEERRAQELEGKSWWDYIDAKNRSTAYQNYLGHTPRVLVAADPEVANTKTMGDILLQLLFNLADPGVAVDRVLNGPTSEVWIGPWLHYLKERGVDYRHGSELVGIQCANGRVAGVQVRANGQVRTESADYYVAALPVERMAGLLTRDLLALDPTLEGIAALAKHVDWMNGIQYYLLDEIPSVYGHQMYLGSPWALTALSQAQFWYDDEDDFARDFGDGTVRAVLSVDVSDWTKTRGRNGKLGRECDRDEAAREVWAQLKETIGLEDRDLHPGTPWEVDRALQPVRGGGLTNAEPLLVNRPDTWKLRPWAQTRIPNLFLAADYVRTHTNLATMEAANEAARRAVNAIIEASRAQVPQCEVWPLHEPIWVKPWRAWDLLCFRNGAPWGAAFPDAVQAAARAVLQAAPAIGGTADYADFEARETARNGVGVVPSYVQRAVVDATLDVASALERGEFARLGELFTPDVKIVLPVADGVQPLERTDAWVGWLEELRAGGGRIEAQVRRVEAIVPDGRDVVARFALDTAFTTGQRKTGRQSGTLEMRFTNVRDPQRQAPSRWLIHGLNYALTG
jgi:uncharacterized protein with NAD-binding domain and iron-sulfur cluster